ncbi:MAG: hypothetical protein R2882_03090 [Gemmatimonadales bacterium]
MARKMLGVSAEEWLSLRRVLVLLGLGLTLTALVGQVQAFLPPQWRRPEWEVAYLGEFSATLATLVLGLVILGGVTRHEGWWTRAILVALGCLVVGVWALAGSAVVALDLPIVFATSRGAPLAEQAIGMRVVAVKGVVLSIVYGLGTLRLGAILLRRPEDSAPANS